MRPIQHDSDIPGEELARLPEHEIVSAIVGRLRALVRAGCESDDCLPLASRIDIPIERVLGLLRRGCPPDLALRILV